MSGDVESVAALVRHRRITVAGEIFSGAFTPDRRWSWT